jgi:hypothetical protein
MDEQNGLLRKGSGRSSMGGEGWKWRSAVGVPLKLQKYVKASYHRSICLGQWRKSEANSKQHRYIAIKVLCLISYRKAPYSASRIIFNQ